MPDPIPSSNSSSSYLPIDGASAEENDGQLCLSSAHPNESASPSDAASAPPSSPAVASLVLRFSPPTGVHPPIKPSLTEAALNCSGEVVSATLGVVKAAVAPAGLAASLVSGVHALFGVNSAVRCIERDEAQQVAKAEIANQSADCARDGAIPLLKADGSVICAFP